MAYSTGYVSVLAQGGSKQMTKIFALKGVDAGTAVDAAGYWTDAGDNGAVIGDVVLYVKVDSLSAPTAASEGRWFLVTAISAAGAGTLTEIAQTALA